MRTIFESNGKGRRTSFSGGERSIRNIYERVAAQSGVLVLSVRDLETYDWLQAEKAYKASLPIADISALVTVEELDVTPHTPDDIGAMSAQYWEGTPPATGLAQGLGHTAVTSPESPDTELTEELAEIS